jgi:hypothetical protein
VLIREKGDILYNRTGNLVLILAGRRVSLEFFRKIGATMRTTDIESKAA